MCTVSHVEKNSWLMNKFSDFNSWSEYGVVVHSVSYVVGYKTIQTVCQIFGSMSIYLCTNKLLDII